MFHLSYVGTVKRPPLDGNTYTSIHILYVRIPSQHGGDYVYIFQLIQNLVLLMYSRGTVVYRQVVRDVHTYARS